MANLKIKHSFLKHPVHFIARLDTLSLIKTVLNHGTLLICNT